MTGAWHMLLVFGCHDCGNGYFYRMRMWIWDGNRCLYLNQGKLSQSPQTVYPDWELGGITTVLVTPVIVQGLWKEERAKGQRRSSDLGQQNTTERWHEHAPWCGGRGSSDLGCPCLASGTCRRWECTTPDPIGPQALCCGPGNLASGFEDRGREGEDDG
jgi:hypothetical protein